MKVFKDNKGNIVKEIPSSDNPAEREKLRIEAEHETIKRNKLNKISDIEQAKTTTKKIDLIIAYLKEMV